jgi:predicted small integral membrane protein
LAEWFMSWSSSWDTTHYEMPILYYMMLFLFYIPQSHRFEIAAV